MTEAFLFTEKVLKKGAKDILPVEDIVDYCRDLIKNAISDVIGHEVMEDKYRPELESKRELVDSLSAMLGDDKDPDSLAKRILEQRKKAQQASTADISAEKAEISVKEETKEITKEIPAVKVEEESTKEIIKPAPEDKKDNAISENNIINNI